MIKINMLSPEQQKANELLLKFQKAFRERSFSGRNAELGKMFNCPACGLRHRQATSQCHRKLQITFANKPGTPEGEINPMIAEPRRLRGQANPYGWRAKPGKFFWIKELKTFATIDQGGQMRDWKHRPVQLPQHEHQE